MFSFVAADIWKQNKNNYSNCYQHLVHSMLTLYHDSRSVDMITIIVMSV